MEKDISNDFLAGFSVYNSSGGNNFAEFGFSFKNNKSTHIVLGKFGNSFNHFSLGSCVEWMYEYCLGIRPNAELGGCRTVDFRPYFDPSGHITSAQGHYDTDFGRIEVHWEKQEDTFLYTVTRPAAISGSFEFPNCTVLSHTQEGDIHSFILKLA